MSQVDRLLLLLLLDYGKELCILGMEANGAVVSNGAGSKRIVVVRLHFTNPVAPHKLNEYEQTSQSEIEV